MDQAKHLVPAQVMVQVKLQVMAHPPQEMVQVKVKPQLMDHQPKVLAMAQAKVKLLGMVLMQAAQAMVKALHKLMVVQLVELAQALVKDQLVEEMHQLQVQVPVKVPQMSLMVDLAQFKAHATLTRI